MYRRCLDPQNSNITLLDGPPGTGKSKVITNLVLQLLYGTEVRQKKRILIAAQSNAAVDIITKKLIRIRSKIENRAKSKKLF